MKKLNYNQTTFVKSVQEISQLPPDMGVEIALAGRSNAGKSSALNAITSQNRLARTSKTPGRTQLLNFFQVAEQRFLVDLPGYGYAKVPEAVKIQWHKTLNEYLETRQCLQGVLLMMDIRHPLQPFDKDMIEWASYQKIPLHILLTKSDKLKRGPANNTLLKIRKALSGYEDLVSIQLFSAVQPTGIEEAHAKLDGWFHID